MMLKGQILFGGFRKKKVKPSITACRDGVVVKDGAMIKHLDQTTTLFHILSHLQSRTD